MIRIYLGREAAMGYFLNPGNEGFQRILNAEYVDKTGLIELMNCRIDTPNGLVCVSRPRRFGKSYAAKMLTAYYDCTCDSHGLFDDKQIAREADYEKHLNQYNIIYLDITNFISVALRDGIPYRDIPGRIVKDVFDELLTLDSTLPAQTGFENCLIQYISRSGGRKFIFIIDEWDALIREAKDDETAQKRYLNLLRGWFKNSNFTPRAVAAAYMTGILPIKKDGSQSAISDFEEYTMLFPMEFADYIGFTEQEVRSLCEKHRSDFCTMKQWYDGYSFKNIGSIYNPNSVMKAVKNNLLRSYWTETSAAESLLDYISTDRRGLGMTVAKLLGGTEASIDVNGFSNDLVTFRNQDDVLTLLVHLGYLSYDETTGRVRIPNEEIRLEFSRTLKTDPRPETMKRVAESDRLILDTIHQRTDAVAAQIEKVHIEATNPLNANNENSLRATIQLAYFSYKDYYMKMEELPAGHGFADIVYLPKPDALVPALLVELKWNQSADTAIHQIKDNKYPEALRDYKGEVLLVGISYNKDLPAGQRHYECVFECLER